MKRNPRSRTHRRPGTLHSVRTRGFTLVEMLVAVGLVVLMMTLFTTIFTMATGSMSKQKAVAENDQRVRLAQTLLRSDLNRRTFQLVRPFIPGDLLEDEDKRRGYIYIAENSPDSQIDDVLQLTVRGTPDDPFNGRCVVFSGYDGYASYPNQPEYDDAQTVNNGSTQSTFAEVAYFLRNGTLYRRVLLGREPLVANPPEDGTPKDGATGGGNRIPMTQYEAAGATLNYYSDFDNSAYWDLGNLGFHGPNTQRNQTSAYAMGKPLWRFGFDHNNGIPREYADQWIDSAGVTQNSRKFFGRFTHEETSFVDSANAAIAFGYPARVTAEAPNPYVDPALSPPGTSLTLDTRDGRITRYRGGSRIGEDVLLENVLSFDIKVYDDAASMGPDGLPGKGFDPATNSVWDDDGQPPNLPNTPNDDAERGWPDTDDGEFVDLGHNGTFGFYRATAIPTEHRNAGGFCYNPADTNKPLFRFDTWHPEVNMYGSPAFDPPPFVPPDYVIGGTTYKRALRAIQIRVTFIDPQSQQTREFTLVQSLKPE